MARELARHSTVQLTLDRYTFTLMETRSEAINQLPDFTAAPSEAMKATGTDGDKMPAESAHPFAHPDGGQRRTLMNCNEQNEGIISKPPIACKPSKKAVRRLSNGSIKDMGGARIELATPGFSVLCSTD